MDVAGNDKILGSEVSPGGLLDVKFMRSLEHVCRHVQGCLWKCLRLSTGVSNTIAGCVQGYSQTCPKLSAEALAPSHPPILANSYTYALPLLHLTIAPSHLLILQYLCLSALDPSYSCTFLSL